jgi:hypothetical protein
VKIEQGRMSLTMQPLTPDETNKFQHYLKQPIPAGE